jgi:DNA-binding NtrC family response regulator
LQVKARHPDCDLRGMDMESRSKRRVFVVDNEHTIAWSLAQILNNKGFEATAFTKPMEALEAASQKPLDLLISDIVMPHMTGTELAIQVLEHHPECKVVLFSGQAGIGEVADLAKKHNFEVLWKPVHPMALLKRIQTAFGIEA